MHKVFSFYPFLYPTVYNIVWRGICRHAGKMVKIVAKKISPSKLGLLGLNKYKLALEGGIGYSKFIFF